MDSRNRSEQRRSRVGERDRAAYVRPRGRVRTTSDHLVRRAPLATLGIGLDFDAERAYVERLLPSPAPSIEYDPWLWRWRNTIAVAAVALIIILSLLVVPALTPGQAVTSRWSAGITGRSYPVTPTPGIVGEAAPAR